MEREKFFEFRRVFVENVRRRSRTAKGKVHTNVSPLKLPLLLADDPEMLAAQIHLNLLKTAEMLCSPIMMENSLSHEWFGLVFDMWFDQLQKGLLDIRGYSGKRKELGLRLFNLRYRIWEVNYDPTSPKPDEIEPRMQVFFAELEKWMVLRTISYNKLDFARLLAFADRELDRVIHPWLDGCGRFATAVVMWLAVRTPAMPLPQFGEREEHYAAMDAGLEAHTEYFVRCLSR